MCHVAAWYLDREYSPHHGPAFWRWAERFMDKVPGIEITRLHSFAVRCLHTQWFCFSTESES